MMINAKALGLAAGIMWGVCLFVLTLLSVYSGYSYAFLKVIQSLYPGFQITPLGSIIGMLWGFVDGYVGFFILAWLYNKFNSWSEGCSCR